ncbi:cyclic peptide export ABC transporter, partial [Dickeya dianthicola]|uniref:hypothetical protein n=1 Tax=Dickeya dianthicola TaxID=204039 RepID=UPI001384F736
MGLFRSFSHSAPNRVLLSILFGALAGAVYAFLIPLTLSGLQSLSPSLSVLGEKTISLLGVTISNYRLALLFSSAIVLILIFTSMSEILLINVGIDFARKLRKDIYHKISLLSVVDLERLGKCQGS